MTYDARRAPLTTLVLVLSALTCWTCTDRPSVTRAAPRCIGAAPTTGEEVPAARPDPEPSDGPARPVVEAPPEPEPVDEGVPGLRMPIHDPGGHALDALHAALRRAQAGEGQARILVYGASHVAADFTTGYLREQLQSRFGDAGHGFILPAQPWRSYRHRDVQIESNYRLWDGLRVRASTLERDRYGLAGVAVESSRRGAYGRVSTAASGDFGRSVSRFELWYMKQPGGGDLSVFIDGEGRGRLSTRADAPGAAYALYEVPDGAHSFEIRVRGNGPVRIFGLSMERDRPGVIVDTLGINGARARYHLLWEDSLYREQLARRRPDLIVLAYGTNESGDDDVPIERYEERVRQVVGRVREVLPGASCLLIGPSDRPLRDRAEGTVEDRPRTAQLIEVQRRVSEDFGCGFFDLVAFMGGPLAMVRWVQNDPPYGAPDYVHFTRRGYLRLGEVLLAALLRGYGEVPEPGAGLVAQAAGPADRTPAE